jgi:hypothetical protein
MNCHDFEKLVLSLARNRLLDATSSEQGLIHTEYCERCAARLAEEQALLARMRAVAVEMAGEEPPARIDAALLAAFRAQTAATTSPTVILAPGRVRHWLSWKFAAVAAGILILISAMALFWRSASSRKPQPGELVNTPAPGSAPGLQVTPLPSAPPQEDRERTMAGQPEKQRKRSQRRVLNEDSAEAEIATQFILLREGEDLTSMERLSLVRVELPGSAIKEVGIPIVLEFTNTTVTADVLLGQDGLARAIRLVAANTATESIKRDSGEN